MMSPTRSFISRAALLVKVTAKNLAGPRAAGGEDVRDARGQHARLAGAGAGQHQHRAVECLDRAALLGVEVGEIVARPTRGQRARGNAAGGGRRRRCRLDIALQGVSQGDRYC